MRIILTGAAGFVGFHAASALLAGGHRVVGVDSVNDYYDPALKRARLALLRERGLAFHELDISDREALAGLFAREADATHVLHLAAQAGVRYSIVNPYAYVQANVMGHVAMLEAARGLKGLEHFVYASSSSVYGLNAARPFRETDRVDTPTSLYAATKRADELIGHSYAHQFGLPQTGLRFFTVYGPWGRPDMSYYLFARAIAEGRPLELYQGGRLKRDFTYIDDIVDGVVKVLARPPEAGANPRVLNIGNNRSEYVSTLVGLLEAGLGRRAIVRDAPRPAADVEETWASVEAIRELVGYDPATTLETGVPKFVEWFLGYHGV